jgi:copper chaperone CopZ
MTHTYNISGMTCGGCVAKVKSELLKLGDVTSPEVQLTAPQATITMQHHLPVQKLQETISKAGNYAITEAEGHGMSQSMEDVKSGDSYYPIFLIFGYITGITLLIQLATRSFDLML